MTEKPHPALARLEPLIGTWRLTGRTLDATEDNITGRVNIEWLPGGFFMVQRGEIAMPSFGLTVQSLEIIGYDPSSDTFRSTVYSDMDGMPATYFWDVQGKVVTHWTAGSKYTGAFSEDGKTLTGGWRPEGGPGTPGSAYDATMIRIA